MEPVQTGCCIVGGGPAGIMLGFLLARAGVQVTVLEKHKDFFRDFRGDTVHPSTLNLMKELGILDEFLRLPHRRIDAARANFGGQTFEMASLKKLKIDTPFIALMPQWDFLNFLTSKARAYPGFNLLMEHEATGLIERENRVSGVIAKTAEDERRGEIRIGARLIVACDGRHSTMRAQAKLPVREIGVPIDVLWFRLSRKPSDAGEQVLGNVNYGKFLILIDRGDYYQAGLLIAKDAFPAVQQQGLLSFRETIVRMVPALADRVEEIGSWDEVKLLSVQINHLLQWSRPGLLCIGDAAHAMSPVFGVGINLAIQDAVATANLLAVTLRDGRNPDPLLALVQKRRAFPATATQTMQRAVHNGLQWVFRQHGAMKPPPLIKVVAKIPGAQSFIARVVGVGIRPEHVRTPEIQAVAASR
jgi:2-polyprenyl-6-methoxyphenol hydroxylase-like FAD-dependent oxidoreductase